MPVAGGRMYTIPDSFQKNMFVGLRLNLVSFTENQVNLHFENDISLYVESSYSINKTNAAYKARKVPTIESKTQNIIGDYVVSVTINDNKTTLSLFFSKGYVFRCFDDSEIYESFIVRTPEMEIIV
jgi:hypothetical protein